MRNDYGLRHQHEKGSFKQKAKGSGGGKRLMGGKQGKMSKDWLKGRGQISMPKPAKAGVNSDKGTVKGGGGQPLKMAGKNPISGTMQGMGAAKKGGKYTWTGTNKTKW